MFSSINLIKYLTLLCHVGFFISSISGFYQISNEFNLCSFMNSLIIFLNVPIFIYLEIINKNVDSIQLIHYGRSYMLMIMSLMIIGLSPIGIGFCIYGIIVSIVNFFLGLFNVRENSISDNSNLDNDTEDGNI